MTFLKCFLVSVLSLSFFSGSCNEKQTATTYYISPKGSDKNIGSMNRPWKTLYKAAQTLTAGDTAILMNGKYYEDKVTIFKNSGLKNRRIVVKAYERHKASVIYSSKLRGDAKILIRNRNFITIQDLLLSQIEDAKNRPIKTTDIVIRNMNTIGNEIIGNKIINGSVGIKSHGSYGTLIENNEILNMHRTSIDVLNDANSLVSRNRIEESGFVGIMIKGGSRDIIVSKNSITNYKKKLTSSAITIGGETDKVSTYDNSKKGYEAYNILCFNNKIISKLPGGIDNGIAYIGSRNCKSYNNIIIGATNGFKFYNSPGKRNGWGWDPINDNPIVKNNIITDCSDSAMFFQNEPVNLDSDFNLYFNNGKDPNEPNSIYDDPQFIDKYKDWRLQDESPAKGKGTILPEILIQNLKSKAGFRLTSQMNIGNIGTDGQ